MDINLLKTNGHAVVIRSGVALDDGRFSESHDLFGREAHALINVKDRLLVSVMVNDAGDVELAIERLPINYGDLDWHVLNGENVIDRYSFNGVIGKRRRRNRVLP